MNVGTVNAGAPAAGPDRVKEAAAMNVAAMGLDAMKQQAADLTKLMQSAQVISDPAQGQRLNILA